MKANVKLTVNMWLEARSKEEILSTLGTQSLAVRS